MEVKRGDIVVAALPGDFGKPRPAVIVQSDRYVREFHSVLLCPRTTTITRDPTIRVLVFPTPENGLTEQSSVMVEKMIGFPRIKIAKIIGRLDDASMARVDFSLSLVLGLI